MGRYLVVFIMLVCACQFSLAQDRDVKTIVGFACFYEGRPTKSVRRAERHLSNSNYKFFSKMLVAPESYNKFLAVIVLERLDRIGKRSMTEKEKKLVNMIRQSEEPVTYCSGCACCGQLSLRRILSFEFEDFYSTWLRQK